MFDSIFRRFLTTKSIYYWEPDGEHVDNVLIHDDSGIYIESFTIDSVVPSGSTKEFLLTYRVGSYSDYEHKVLVFQNGILQPKHYPDGNWFIMNSADDMFVLSITEDNVKVGDVFTIQYPVENYLYRL